MNKYKYYILSFVIPFLIILTVLLFRNAIDGEFSIIVSDLFGQYYKLFHHFKNTLLTEGNVFYSFSKGLGGGMISTYAYYLISPTNLLLLIFNNIYLYTLLTILLKISFCGTTMFIYLKYHFKDKKETIIFLFSIAYALSLYNIGNYFQVMWLDCLLISPLILLGIDKIVLEKKSLLYGITLFIAILTNYYIGYMICLFSVLYFIYKSILYKKYHFKIFTITSLLSGLMTMFINIPNIIITLSGQRISTVLVDTINNDYLGILSRIFIGSHDFSNVLNPKTAYLYCGIIVLPLVMLYFINKKIDLKEKILSGVMILVLLLSIIISPINYLWHFFSPPNYYNYRYIFLFVIFILYIACKSFFNIKTLTKQDYFLTALVLPVLGLLVYFRNIIPLSMIYISVGLYLLYLYILYNFNESKEIKILFVMLMICELYFNINFIFINFNFSYSKYINGRYEEQLESSSFLKSYDKDFYRFEHQSASNYNEAFYYNYPTSSVFLSTLNFDLDFLNKLGFEVGNNYYRYISYPITDALLGIKYYETIEEKSLYNKVYTHEIGTLEEMFYGIDVIDSHIYENPYALSLGYIINNSELVLKTNPFDVQMQILKNMTNIDLPIYHKQVIEENNYVYEVLNDNDFSILYDLKVNSEEYEYHVYINNKLYEIKKKNQINISNIKNNFKKGEKVNIEFKVISGDVKITKLTLFTFNADNFNQYINHLKTQQLNIKDIKDGYINGNINVTKEGILFSSILYEKGWTAYVDGKQVELEKVYDTFIGIPLDKGYHDIKLVYHVPGLKIGIIVSLISGLLFILYQIKINNQKN